MADRAVNGFRIDNIQMERLDGEIPAFIVH